MKNIPLSHLLERALKPDAAPFHNTVSMSRLEAGVSTDRAHHSFYYNNLNETTSEIVKWLQQNGYLTVVSERNCLRGFLLTPGKDYVVGFVDVAFGFSSPSADLYVYGDTDECKKVCDWIKTTYPSIGSAISTAVGLYRDGTVITEESLLQIKDSEKAHQSFYPWLGISLEEYYDAFMASSETVLVLFGPPGSGKSTFIRSLIASKHYPAMLAYNKEIVESPRLISLFFGSKSEILAYEDIDKHMSAREDGNTLMSTILNAADGVMKHPGKKMIFSTNLSSIDKIDPALLRVGRCFDILKFRDLTVQEAQHVLEQTGQPMKDFSSKKHWSLAEILAKESNAQQAVNRFAKKIGF